MLYKRASYASRQVFDNKFEGIPTIYNWSLPNSKSIWKMSIATEYIRRCLPTHLAALDLRRIEVECPFMIDYFCNHFHGPPLTFAALVYAEIFIIALIASSVHRYHCNSLFNEATEKIYNPLYLHNIIRMKIPTGYFLPLCCTNSSFRVL